MGFYDKESCKLGCNIFSEHRWCLCEYVITTMQDLHWAYRNYPIDSCNRGCVFQSARLIYPSYQRYGKTRVNPLGYYTRHTMCTSLCLEHAVGVCNTEPNCMGFSIARNNTIDFFNSTGLINFGYITLEAI